MSTLTSTDKQKQDFKVHEDDEPTLTIRVKTRDAQGNQIPYDLTNTTAYMVIKNNVSDVESAAVVKYGNGSGETGLVYTDAVNGVMTISITSAATQLGSNKGRYVYYIKLRVNGKPRTLKHGEWYVQEI